MRYVGVVSAITEYCINRKYPCIVVPTYTLQGYFYVFKEIFMAERRMFAKTIIDSDAFLDMPLSAQSLYFHLSMRADDEGFINNPKKIQRMIGASDDDLRILVAKSFIIPFESGIVVIKHWKIHNYIRNDRYKETVYQEERAMLQVKENNSYTLGMSDGIPDGRQNGHQMDTQVRIGKDSIGKDNSIGEKRKRFIPPTLEEVKAYASERGNLVDAQKFYDYYTQGGWKDAKGNAVKNWKQKMITWEKHSDKPKQNRINYYPQNDVDLAELEKKIIAN